jgi:type IV secretory pathway protease TraF
LILHDWTTYFFAGVVVAGGLGLVYYWENYDIVRFEEEKAKHYNEPEVEQGVWRVGHLTDPIEPGTNGQTYVVFKRPGDSAHHLARVVAREGQRVQVTDKDLLVDGQPYEVLGVKNKTSLAEVPELVVPRGCLFVISDNRSRRGSVENDSRSFGPIPLDAVTHAFKWKGKRKD